MPTNQEIFDRVVSALREQGEPCVNEHRNCVYRNSDGLKCAAGHLIPDDKYDPSFENTAVGSFSDNNEYNKVTQLFFDMDYNNDNIELVSQLQSIHDEYDFYTWEDQWRKLAEREGLVYCAPK